MPPSPTPQANESSRGGAHLVGAALGILGYVGAQLLGPSFGLAGSKIAEQWPKSEPELRRVSLSELCDSTASQQVFAGCGNGGQGIVQGVKYRYDSIFHALPTGQNASMLMSHTGKNCESLDLDFAVADSTEHTGLQVTGSVVDGARKSKPFPAGPEEANNVQITLQPAGYAYPGHLKVKLQGQPFSIMFPQYPGRDGAKTDVFIKGYALCRGNI